MTFRAAPGSVPPSASATARTASKSGGAPDILLLNTVAIVPARRWAFLPRCHHIVVGHGRGEAGRACCCRCAASLTPATPSAPVRHPTAEWVTRQLTDAFPFDTAPRYLIRDRDGIYGQAVRQKLATLGIEEILTAPHSPWQNPYVERLIGSIRRDLLDHVIVFGEKHLYRLLKNYFAYYHESRTHPSLDRNAPIPRIVEPPEQGKVIAIAQAGGLHHRYRRAA